MNFDKRRKQFCLQGNQYQCKNAGYALKATPSSISWVRSLKPKENEKFGKVI